MNPKWKWFLPGYVNALPLTIFGLILASVFYRGHSWQFRNGIISCIGNNIIGNPGGQTFGNVQIYKDEWNRKSKRMRTHETCHTVQAFVLGILMAVAYPAMFLWYYLTEQKEERAGWKDDYHLNPFEKQAYAKQDNDPAWC